jgi:hypothetical protein
VGDVDDSVDHGLVSSSLHIIEAGACELASSPAARFADYQFETISYRLAYGKRMKAVLVLALALLQAGSILAADLGPSSQLMLAAIVAQYSPQVGTAIKQELSRLAEGDLTKPETEKDFVVSADSIDCRASDVDITSRSCIIMYGSKAVSLSGRSAHELFSTITEVGVSAGASAGTYTVGLSSLNCTVSPSEVSAGSGGGVHCTFKPSAP